MTFKSYKWNCSLHEIIGHTVVCKAGKKNCNYKVCTIKEIDIPIGVQLL